MTVSSVTPSGYHLGTLEFRGAMRTTGCLQRNAGKAIGTLLGSWRDGGRMGLLQTAGCSHQQKDHPGNDQEIDDSLDEQSVIEGRRPGLLCRLERGIHLAVQADKQIAEVHP